MLNLPGTGSKTAAPVSQAGAPVSQVARLSRNTRSQQEDEEAGPAETVSEGKLHRETKSTPALTRTAEPHQEKGKGKRSKEPEVNASQAQKGTAVLKNKTSRATAKAPSALATPLSNSSASQQASSSKRVQQKKVPAVEQQTPAHSTITRWKKDKVSCAKGLPDNNDNSAPIPSPLTDNDGVQQDNARARTTDQQASTTPEVDAQIRTLTEEKDFLLDAWLAARRENEELGEENDTLKANNEALKAEHEALQEANELLEIDLENLKDTLDYVKASRDRFEKRAEDLESNGLGEYSAMLKQRETMGHRIKALEKEVNKLRAKYESLTEEKEKMAGELGGMKTTLKKMIGE